MLTKNTYISLVKFQLQNFILWSDFLSLNFIPKQFHIIPPSLALYNKNKYNINQQQSGL